MFYDNGFMLKANAVAFRRAEDGSLLMDMASGTQAVHNLTSAFPLSSPGRMVTLRGEDGEELAMLDDVRKLDRASRRLVLDELERTYFMPVIQSIGTIDENLNIVRWTVETDRGPRMFQIRSARKNVRKLPGRRLVIRDVDGNRYEIRDWQTLDSRAQQLIEEFI